MTRYITVLKQADIFYGLTPTQLELIAGICQEKTYAAGEIILPEGSSSDELYVIMKGDVEILVNPDLVSHHPGKPSSVSVACLGRGQSFGEIALVDRGLRSATVRSAQNNTMLLVIPRDKLLQLCETFPQLGYRLMFNLAADLALKARMVDLRTREGLVDHPHTNK